MKIVRLWIVRDPSPVSTLVDIVFETTPAKLPNYIRGCQPGDWEGERHAMYTEESAAMADARARLAAHDSVSAVSR
jgi:hypothetical protein